jgi:signal transduction histidine kinase
MRRYLIVDDNLDFAENLAEIVRDGGDEVAIAEDGRAALALAREQRFDAVLTDMRMPLMGGAELVHEIRRIDPGAAAMVITAHVSDDALEAARREGLLAVLSKPVAVGRLLELLAVARRDGLVAVVEDDPRMSDNLCEALPSIDGDPVQLRQVFVNLIENAVFAASPQGAVTIRGRREPGVVELDIEDTGPGVDAATRRRLFEPLITTKDKGIGLGLALVKRIAERHGGTVSYSDRPGGGARFTVRLPA